MRGCFAVCGWFALCLLEGPDTRIIKKLTKPTDSSNLAVRPDALWPSRSLQSRLADRLLSKTHYPGPDVVGPDFKIRRSLLYSSAQKILQLTALHGSNSLLIKNN